MAVFFRIANADILASRIANSGERVNILHIVIVCVPQTEGCVACRGAAVGRDLR